MSVGWTDWPRTHRGWPGLTSSDPVVDGILRDLFAAADGPNTRVNLAVDDRSSVIRGDGLISWTVDGQAQDRQHLAEILFRAVGMLNREALEVDPERFHLHAALVGDDDRIVMIPGVRGAGKTTMTAALIDRGWSYGTDEMVAIDRSGGATALRKPLNCKPGSLERFEHVRRLRHPALEHWPTDRAQLGIPPRWLPSEQVEVTDIVVPLRSNRFATPRLVPMTAADAVAILAENSFDFERHGPGPSLDVAAKLVAGARRWNLLHNDAVAAADLLDQRLTSPDQEAEETPSPEVITIPALETPSGGPHPRQATCSHGMALDGHGLIWTPHLDRVVRVTPPAFAAWATADGTTSLAERAALLATTPAELRQVDDQLVQTGVLEAGTSAD